MPSLPRLHDLPAAARPREKLLAQGAAALADAELLALLLRTGTRGQSVLQMADRLLERVGGPAGLMQATPASLCGMPGLGPAKRAELAAAAELARRALRQRLQARPVFEQPSQLLDYVQMKLGGLGREVFAAAFLDSHHRLIAWDELFHGTLTEASVWPREVVKQALARNACHVVFAHNHPSGIAEPSPADRRLTRQLRHALALVDVQVLDHLIVGEGRVRRMAEDDDWL